MKMTSKPNVSLDARSELVELVKRKAEITVITNFQNNATQLVFSQFFYLSNFRRLWRISNVKSTHLKAPIWKTPNCMVILFVDGIDI